MGTLYEGRLDGAVDAGAIGIHEKVDIRTKMGVPVATGEVIGNNPFGIILREHGFFDRDLYLFVPLTDRPGIRPMNIVNSSPDERVMEGLRRRGESVPIYEAEKLDDKDSEVEDGDEKGDDKNSLDDKVDKGEKKRKAPDAEPIAKPDSSVDIDGLPDDIKKAVISTTQMTEDQLNGVLGEIGDITVKSLKRANVKDTEVYGVASKVQHAIYRILTGKPPAPPAPPKKKGR